MLVLLAGLPIFYYLYNYLQLRGYFFDRPSKYLLFFPNFGEFIEAIWPLCWLGTGLFLYSAYSYRRFFLQYLISDFVTLRVDNSNYTTNRFPDPPLPRSGSHHWKDQSPGYVLQLLLSNSLDRLPKTGISYSGAGVYSHELTASGEPTTSTSSARMPSLPASEPLSMEAVYVPAPSSYSFCRPRKAGYSG